MIVVRVELHHATAPGKVTELARMIIANDGSSAGPRRSYFAKVFRGRSTEQLSRMEVHKTAELKNWPSEQVHVWNLVAAFLSRLGYGEKVKG